MEKLIVLNCDDKQDGANYKCILPQIKISAHAQVCLVAYDIDLNYTSNDIMLVNIPTLPIQTPVANPHGFGFLSTIASVSLPLREVLKSDDTTEFFDGWFKLGEEKYVSLNNQEEINLTELHVLLTDPQGVPLTMTANITTIVIKFRVDPKHIADARMREQANILAKIMADKSTENLNIKERW